MEANDPMTASADPERDAGREGPGADEPGREEPPRDETDPGDEPSPPPAGGSGGRNESEASQPVDLNEIFERGQAEERAGQSEEALRLYRSIVHRDPDHVRARNRLGALLHASGTHDAALEHFRAALQVEPENPAVLTNLGSALGALGRNAEAERMLRHAMALQPEGVDAKVHLARLNLRRGLYNRAEAELRAVCEQAPDHATAQLYHGEALSRLDRVDAGLAALERAARLDPENPRTFYLMGVLYDKKHLPREAAVMYRRSRELAD